jgi:hypothetical protein
MKPHMSQFSTLRVYIPYALVLLALLLYSQSVTAGSRSDAYTYTVLALCQALFHIGWRLS